MILLVGSNQDRVLKYFAKFLVDNLKTAVFIDQSKISNSILIHNDFFSINSANYYYRDFTGVLSRIVSVKDSAFCKKIIEGNQLLSCVVNTRLKNVVNSIEHCVSNNSKLYQTNHLKRINILLPKSKILAKISLSNFIKTKKYSRYIFKSLGSIRSIVTEVDYSLHPTITPTEPVLLQELLLGKNIRVHVIKDKCYSTLITSTKIDYRYDYEGRRFIDYDLPDSIKNECIIIAKNMSLTFCGIDLIKIKDQYYILEVNPSPGYSFYEKNLTHKNISKGLMNTLLN